MKQFIVFFDTRKGKRKRYKLYANNSADALYRFALRNKHLTFEYAEDFLFDECYGWIYYGVPFEARNIQCFPVKWKDQIEIKVTN